MILGKRNNLGTMEDLEHQPNLRFFEILRDFSDDKRDPVPEWEFKGFITTGTKEKCICGTKILLNYQIVHKRTQKQLIIGSECIKRWIQPKLSCSRCDAPLGRVLERTRKGDFHCRSCKRELKEMEKQKLLKMGRLRLFWYGKYYQRMFAEVAQDIPYVESLLNLPEEKKTDTLKALEKYISLKYDIKEVEVDV